VNSALNILPFGYKTNQFKLYREVKPIYSGKNTKPINALPGQNTKIS
jgi:hypothetical protein